jgi:hypothetical protein
MPDTGLPATGSEFQTALASINRKKQSNLTAYSVERFDISFFDIILSEATATEPNNSMASMIWSTVEN